MNTDNILHYNILMFESVFHSLYLFCVCCLLMELITLNSFKRVSQKRKECPRAVVTTLLEIQGEQC